MKLIHIFSSGGGFALQCAGRTVHTTPTGTRNALPRTTVPTVQLSIAGHQYRFTWWPPCHDKMTAPISASLPIVNLLCRLASPRTFARRGGDYVAIIPPGSTRVKVWRFQP